MSTIARFIARFIAHLLKTAFAFCTTRNATKN